MKTNMAVEDYMEEITLTYYCFNVVLAIVFFAYGTYYLKKRDKRDELRREWRQFAETVDREYSKLKDESTHQRVLEIKESLGSVKVCNEITGVDVLSYMIHHCADFPRFQTREFGAFREDLKKILRLLRICHSLIAQLGTVPDDIKEEVGELVTDLGKITLPFFKGRQSEIIVKCLEHFGSQSPSENSVTDTDMTNAIPYVEFLVFTWVYKAPGADPGKKVKKTKDKCPECVAFTLDVNGPLTCELKEETKRELLQELDVLIQLQKRIVELENLKDFVRELRRKWRNLFSDEEECPVNDVSVVLRVLHEVRGYIYSKVKREEINAGKQRKIEVFRTVYRDVIELRLTDWKVVLDICQRFKADLSNLEKSESDYHRSTTFREEFSDLYLKYVKVVDPSGKMVETHI